MPRDPKGRGLPVFLSYTAMHASMINDVRMWREGDRGQKCTSRYAYHHKDFTVEDHGVAVWTGLRHKSLEGVHLRDESEMERERDMCENEIHETRIHSCMRQGG